MEINLDGYALIDPSNCSWTRDICEQNIRYVPETGTYVADRSSIRFAENDDILEIFLGPNAWINGTIVHELSNENFLNVKREASELGYVLTKEHSGLKLWYDEFTAVLNDGSMVVLRADVEGTTNCYGEGMPVQNNSRYWCSNDGSFHKAITVERGYYRVNIWGHCSIFGLQFGEPVDMRDVSSHELFVSSTDTYIKMKYKELDILISCTRWSDNVVTLLGVTFDTKLI